MLALILACAPPDAPAPADTPTDTGPGADSGDPVWVYPWADDGFWEKPGPLEALLDPSDLDGTDWAVRIATSDDGVTWTVDPRVVAEGLTSLSVFVAPDGVVVTGLVEANRIVLDPATVYAIVSRDLETWGSKSWVVSGAERPNLVDPTLFEDAGGDLAMTYYSADFGDGDPVYYPGPHEIRRATWDGRWFREDDTPMYAEEELADPVVCDMDGVEYLFVTRSAEYVRIARSTDHVTFEAVDDFAWQDWTVPSCREDEDGIDIVAQPNVTEGQIAATKVYADGTFGEAREIAPLSMFEGGLCSSPSIFRFQDRWVLLCAVYLLHPQP